MIPFVTQMFNARSPMRFDLPNNNLPVIAAFTFEVDGPFGFLKYKTSPVKTIGLRVTESSSRSRLTSRAKIMDTKSRLEATNIQDSARLPRPHCAPCGVDMWLTASEPHPVLHALDTMTFQCPCCQTQNVTVVERWSMQERKVA